MGAVKASMIVDVRAKTDAFEASMKKMPTITKNAASQVGKTLDDELGRARQKAKKHADDTAKVYEDLGKKIRNALGGELAKLGGTLGAVFAVKNIVETADKFTMLEARIKNATQATGDFKRVNEELYKISQRNGAAFEDTVATFQSLARSSKELGATNSDMMKLTDTVQKLGVIGGSTSEQMKNGLLQFSQMMAGGTAHAEEMNSILENTPEIANRIASGMGMTVGQLRAAVKDGTVLSKDVFQALLKQAQEINQEYEKMPLTLDRAGTMLGNSFQQFVGSLNESVNFTGNLAAGMKDVSKTVDEITANIRSWAGKEVTVGNVKTNQATVLQAQLKQAFDAMATGWKSGMQATQDLFTNPGEYMKNLMAGGGKYKSTMDVANDKKLFEENVRQLEEQRRKREAATKKTTVSGKGGDAEDAKAAARFKDFLEDMQARTKEIEQQNAGLTKQAAIEKALYDAAEKKKAPLTAAEAALVRSAAAQKFEAEEAKKSAAEQKKKAEHAKKQAEEHAKIARELEAQGRALDAQLNGQEGLLQWEEKRFKLQEQIRDLTKDQQADLMAKLEANIAKEKEAQHQEIIKGIKEERAELDAILDGREKEIPLIKMIAEEQKKGILTEERRAELQREFLENKRKEAEITFNKLSKEQAEEITNLDLKRQGFEDILPMLEKEKQIREAIGLTEDEKAQMIGELRKQFDVQRQLNRELEHQQDVLEKIKSSDKGYVNQIRQLQDAFNSGQINYKQFLDTMQDLEKSGKKASGFAQDFAKTITKGFDDAITKGKKLSDVFKDIGKNLLALVTQKLSEKLSGFLANGIDRLFGGFGGGNAPNVAYRPMVSPNWWNDPYYTPMAQYGAYNSGTGNQYDPYSNTGGSMAGGYRGLALGGSAWGGMPYMVGENGPEMFVPNMNGFVVPNSGFSVGAANAGRSYEPSYSDMAQALADIGRYREQKFNQGPGGGINGMGLGNLFANNLLGGYKFWEDAASRGASGYAFGHVPGIANGANDFRGFLDREPGLRNVLNQRFVEWIDRASGGVGRNSYTALMGGGGGGGSSMGGDDNGMGNAWNRMVNNGDYDATDYGLWSGSRMQAAWDKSAGFQYSNRATAAGGTYGMALGGTAGTAYSLPHQGEWGAAGYLTGRSKLLEKYLSRDRGDAYFKYDQATFSPNVGGITNAELEAMSKAKADARMGLGSKWMRPYYDPRFSPWGPIADSASTSDAANLRHMGLDRIPAGFSDYANNLKKQYGFGGLTNTDLPFNQKPMNRWEYAHFYGEAAAAQAFGPKRGLGGLFEKPMNPLEYRMFYGGAMRDTDNSRPFPAASFGMPFVGDNDIEPLRAFTGRWSQTGMWSPAAWKSNMWDAARWKGVTGFAKGGHFQRGPMIVGEQGPELVMADTSGTVVPNHALGGAAAQPKIEINNYTPFEPDVQTVQTPQGPKTVVTIGKQAATNIAQGGDLAKMLEQTYGLKRKRIR